MPNRLAERMAALNWNVLQQTLDEQGTGLIFPTNHRPVLGTRGYYKNTLRHGVSTITSGTRYTKLKMYFKEIALSFLKTLLAYEIHVLLATPLTGEIEGGEE